MSKTLKKEIRKIIRSTKGRFLSLTAIVTIGTAFFIGVSSTAPMMALSVNEYDNQYHLKDISIYSTYGFDEDDIENLSTIPEIETVEGTRFVDVIATHDAKTLITRVHEYDKNGKINQFKLVEGRLPEAANEAVAERGIEINPSFHIGDTVKFSRPDNDLGDFLKLSEVKIVGLIDTPLYLNNTKENSSLSNQYLNTYLYVPTIAFDTDYFTEVNILLKNTNQYEPFSDAYFDYGKMVKEKIDDFAKTAAQSRAYKLKDDALKKYDEGLEKYQREEAKYHKKIRDAENTIFQKEKELQDGVKQLQDAEKQLHEGEELLKEKIQEGQAEIDKNQKKLDESKSLLTGKKDELYQMESQIEDGIAKLTTAKQGLLKIDSSLVQIESQETRVKSLDEFLSSCNQGSSIKSPLYELSPSIHKLIDGACLENKKQDLTVAEFKEYLNHLQQNSKITTQEKNQISSAIQLFDEFSTNDQQMVKSVVIKDYELTISQMEEAGIYDDSIATVRMFYEKQLETLDKTKQDLQNKKLQVISDLKKNNFDADHLDDEISKLQQQKQQISAALNGDQNQLIEAQEKIDDAQKQLYEKEAEEQKKIEDARIEIEKNRKTLNDANIKLANGKKELNDKKIDGKKKLEEAKAKLVKAKDDIAKLKNGEWIVLDRSKHYASATYRDTVHQMSAIAAIFPVFFLMVAALVCLTTMTRMIQEQRGQIGILRALGFTKKQCVSIYLWYAGLATIIGEALGCVIGLLTFPKIIYETWKLMYVLPEMKLTIPWLLICETCVMFILVMLFTTSRVTRNDMEEVPAQLLRPKAPRLGKKVFLEKIHVIWDHLSFTWKVTIRNLFRYKKRFYMTILGVAGCTALLVTGFGIRDSIDTMMELQFNQIYRYDGMVRLENDFSASGAKQLLATLEKRDDVDQAILGGYYTSKAYSGSDKDETVRCEIYEDVTSAKKNYLLRQRRNHEPLNFDDEGVIISEKLSKNLDLNVGDEMLLEGENGIKRNVKIEGICEMYIYHYVFMSESYYEKVFHSEMPFNTIYLRVNGDNQVSKALQNDLTKMEGVEGINFYDVLISNFKNMISGLDVVILTLIISSMSLAFVVLGNLTNVNISERFREIATLKVLGFHKKEIESYIYKENNILVLLGSLLGIPIGKILHYYIMHQVEASYITYGKRIRGSSILISVCLTVGFGLLVDMFMKKKLSNIQMVESLKSVE